MYLASVEYINTKLEDGTLYLPNPIINTESEIKQDNDSDDLVLRFDNMSKIGLGIVSKYNNFPSLPYKKHIEIKKIGIFNWDSGLRQSGNLITYSMLCSINPLEYPKGKNSKTDYMPTDYVSPVIIVDTSGNIYKTTYILWFPLSVVYDGIMIKQTALKIKLFPITIYTDEKINGCVTYSI